MKRLLVALALIASAGRLDAQPVTPGGLRAVIHDASLEGTGTAGSPMKIRACTTNDTIKYNGTTWVCDASGGGGFTIAGSGLTSSGVTVNVGAGTAITVNADDVAVTTNGITDALLRQSAGLSVIGRSGNSTGNVADITAASDGDVMRRSAGAVGFGSIPEASVTGVITGVTVTSPGCSAGSYMTSLTGGASSGDAPVGGGCTAEVGDISAVTVSGPISGGGTSGSVAIGMTNADYGDITLTGATPGTTWTIDNSVVTLAKMADLAQSTVIGRAAGAGTGVPTALSATQATAILDTFSTSTTTKGLVPGSNGAGATAFLNGNGGYTVPAGTNTGSGTANTTTKWGGTNALTNGWALDDGTSWGVSGKFLITEASGNTVISGTTTITGLVTATAGVTTPANLTTTGSGDVVSADGVSAVGNITTTSAGGFYTNAARTIGVNEQGTSLAFRVNNADSACSISSAGVFNCAFAGMTENGSAVLSGTIASNTIPKGSGGNLADSHIRDPGAGEVIIDQVSNVGVLTVGVNGVVATDAALSVVTYSDDNVYFDTKVGNAGTTNFRTGHNTEAGSTRTWLTVTGSTGAAAFGTGGVTVAGVFDVNNDLSKFGSVTDGYSYISGNTYNFGYAENTGFTGWINFHGYADSTTQPRNLNVGNGQGATVCSFTGSTKVLDCIGGITVNGTSVATTTSISTAVTGTTNYVAKFSGSNAVGNSAIFESSGAVSMGDGANTAISNNLDVLTIGNTGTGQTTSGLSLANLSHTGTFANVVGAADQTQYGLKLNYSPGTATGCTTTSEPAVDCPDFTFYGVDQQMTIGATGINQVTNLTAYGHNINMVVNGGDGNETVLAYGLKINVDTTTSGAGATQYGVHSTVENVPGATAGYFAVGGDGSGGMAIKTSSGGRAQINGTLAANAGVVVAGGVSTDDLAITGTTSVGNSPTDLATFSNGPAGINTYDGTHFEWNQEWTYQTYVNSNAYTPYIVGTGGGTILQSTTCTGRPGCVEMSTAASATGSQFMRTDPALLDFNANTTSTFDTIVGIPVLSVVAQEYVDEFGFYDTASVNQTDGCYFVYDRLGTLTDPGTGDATGTPGDFWQIWCSANGTRTGYKLDTTSNAQDSFPRVVSAVAAVTFPTTNVYRLKIVVDGSSKAHFWINGTEVGRITTNIPSGSSRMTGAGFLIAKSAGTTIRVFDVDFTSLRYDLITARN